MQNCAAQYIGEAKNTVSVQLMGDQSEVNHDRTDIPVAKHFSQPDHSIHNLTIMVTEKIHREDTDHRRRKENHWKEQLRSLTPNGLTCTHKPHPFTHYQLYPLSTTDSGISSLMMRAFLYPAFIKSHEKYSV